MYSTVQQTAYMVPTSRRALHPSQMPFDPTISLTVKPMSAAGLGPSSSWRNKYDRNCWTAGTSHYHHGNYGNSANMNQMAPGELQPVVVHAQPGYRRSYTLLEPDRSYSMTMPSTANLPRRGQIKLTSFNQHTGATPLARSRAKTVGGHRKQKIPELGKTLTQYSKHAPNSLIHNLGDLTVADLHTVIDTEFPETQGLAFNRASQYIRTATAELMKTHSRPGTGSQASRGGATPLQVHQHRTTRTTDSNPVFRGDDKNVSKSDKTDDYDATIETSQCVKEGKSGEGTRTINTTPINTTPDITEANCRPSTATPVVNIPTS